MKVVFTAQVTQLPSWNLLESATAMCEIQSKLTIKSMSMTRSDVFVDNFEQFSHISHIYIINFEQVNANWV